MNTRQGFTLVEILIVVIILGVLAAIVIPQFSTASMEAKESMMRDDLRTLRSQLQVYRAQHRGLAPGCADANAPATEDVLVAQMTQSSNEDGETAAPGTDGYPYGPYFASFPVNPLNGKCTIQVMGDSDSLPTEADDSHGWIYQAGTGTFLSDAAGSSSSGQAYIEY